MGYVKEYSYDSDAQRQQFDDDNEGLHRRERLRKEAKELVKDASNSSRTFRLTDDQYKYFMVVYIIDIRVESFPDTCSDLNLIPEALVHLNGWKLDNDTETIIRLPDERGIKAVGSVDARCRFAEDGEIFTFSL
jgi:hypothetical protein